MDGDERLSSCRGKMDKMGPKNETAGLIVKMRLKLKGHEEQMQCERDM